MYMYIHVFNTGQSARSAVGHIQCHQKLEKNHLKKKGVGVILLQLATNHFAVKV